MRQWLGQFIGFRPPRLDRCAGAGHSRRLFRGSMLRLDARRVTTVHVLAVVGEVPARLEEPLVEDLRRHHLFVADSRYSVAHVVDELLVDERAARQEERHRRRVLVEHEELELFAELAVVALLRLFEQLQVLVERCLRRERRAVDALEHRVALVAAPVRAGHAGELDGRELAGARARAALRRSRPTPRRARRGGRAMISSSFGDVAR